MPSDFDSAVVTTSGTGDDGPAINAAFATGASSVRVVSDLTVRSTFTIPAYKSLYSEGERYITKGFNGTLCIMMEWSSMFGLEWLGNGGTYTGPGIVCPAGTSRQQFGRFRMTDFEGPCIDMSAPHMMVSGKWVGTGAYASIGGGDLCLLQRNDLHKPAIVLPMIEDGTTGLRRLIGLSGGGFKLIDFANSNVTVFQNCDTYRADMGPNCRYLLATSNRFAIPTGEVLNIRGSNHRFGFNQTSEKVHFTADCIGACYDKTNYDAGCVLDPGAAYNEVGHMMLVPAPINNSGNSTNKIG